MRLTCCPHSLAQILITVYIIKPLPRGGVISQYCVFVELIRYRMYVWSRLLQEIGVHR